MAITERQRQQLLAWYEQHMGPELASTAMELTPPAAWGELATKRDLDVLGQELRAEIRAIDHKIDGISGKLEGDIQGLDHKIDGKFGELRGEFGELRGELRGEMHALASRNLRVFATLLFASQTVVVAIMTLLFTLAR